ncbi:MAG: hypothetical protein N2319_10265 [Candidatus Kapabacteria bacterium]|nr:hypothetical protein [Candidatus Kapabacteria bacterium]
MIEWYIIKVLHILSAIFWMGGSIFISAFLLPAVKKSGPSSKELIHNLFNIYKLPLVLNIASSLTVILGLIQYWKTTAGYQQISFHFPGGIGLFHGIIFGLIAFIWGHAFQSPNSKKLSRLMAQVQDKPSTEQFLQIQKIQKKVIFGGWLTLILLFLSLLGMVSVHF